MSIKIKKTFERTGVVANQCFILIDTIKYRENLTIVKVAYFYDEAAYNGGKEPIMEEKVSLEGEIETRDEIYKELKKMNKFK